MRTRTLHTIAVTLGLGLCTVVQAESPYSSPTKWNNFRTVADTVETPAAALPVPAAPEVTPLTAPSVTQDSSPVASSPYSQAMSSPWAGSTGSFDGSCGDGSCGDGFGGIAARPALSPWFGSANLLYYTLESGRGRSIATLPNGGVVRSSIVDPNSSLGFEIGAGRYFDSGRYGLGLTYMYWNPGQERIIVNEDPLGNGLNPGDIRAETLGFNDVSVDAGSGADTVYSIIDGTAGAYAGAEAVRVTRDIRFQGLEANLYSFGLMGAQRAAYAGCAPGYGGAAGPLVRPSSGRVRIMTSHGFRWFQIKDDFESAFNVDAVGGYQADDIYSRTNVENNLFGYQFGGMLNYCLTSRLNMNLGGKLGVYGNNVNYAYRLGTENNVAYLNSLGAGAGDINVRSSDTVLSGLGELDMGLGYRITNAWSVRGGYRVMAITGVADSVNNAQNTDFSSIAAVSNFDANNSILLHGAYLGLTYNW